MKITQEELLEIYLWFSFARSEGILEMDELLKAKKIFQKFGEELSLDFPDRSNIIEIIDNYIQKY